MRLRERLQRECGRRLTLEDLARDAGLSPSHLARTFRRVTGETVHGCQTRLRLQRACSLLAETTTSITAIALELGYAHSSHFGAAFRRAYGMTPRQYARLHRRVRNSNPRK